MMHQAALLEPDTVILYALLAILIINIVPPEHLKMFVLAWMLNLPVYRGLSIPFVIYVIIGAIINKGYRTVSNIGTYMTSPGASNHTPIVNIPRGEPADMYGAVYVHPELQRVAPAPASN